MRAGLVALVIIVVLGAVVALNSLFITNPAQQALVLQFGEVRQAIREPGLNMKIPVVQDVRYFDKRVLDLNVPAQEIIAADQKRLVVDAFMRYRIANPVRFYQAAQTVRRGESILSARVQSNLRAVLADATFQDIVRDDRPQLMQRISELVAESARPLGVEVVDVKLRRADLPEANSQAIYDRMTTEREQEAREIRAQGQEAAQRVRAAADRTATVLRAEANREAEQIRGQGDGRRNAIFAAAFTQDPDFFAFYRAMQAYEQSLASNDTRLVLSPDADFFRYFNDPAGAAGLTLPTGAPADGSGAAAPAQGAPESGGEGGTPLSSLGTETQPVDRAELEASARAAREALDASVQQAEQDAEAMTRRQQSDAAAAEAEAEAVEADDPAATADTPAPQTDAGSSAGGGTSEDGPDVAAVSGAQDEDEGASGDGGEAAQLEPSDVDDPAERSTEAAVRTATPAPTDAANEAANADVAEPSPLERTEADVRSLLSEGEEAVDRVEGDLSGTDQALPRVSDPAADETGAADASGAGDDTAAAGTQSATQ